MAQLNIAVIGSGISGLCAAWLLSHRHKVTLYEGDGHLGGHANTAEVATPEGTIPVDTGFIVYNEPNYPNLTALFDHLGVATEPTEMSFAVSLDSGAYEYAGSGMRGFFGQKRNLLSPSHWRLLADISRFFRSAVERVADLPSDITLGAFLEREGYSDRFVNDHILPMGAAIWSTPMAAMLEFPARAFLDFYGNHGMLQFRDRPAWRTVTGGSRSYVRRILLSRRFDVQQRNAIRRVRRHPHFVHIEDRHGAMRPFDHVVIATHADQALALLEDPTSAETKHLAQFSYQSNRAWLHRDRRLMPRREALWSSWNYLKTGRNTEGDLCLTYWMNRLQNLKTKTDIFVTLNPATPIHPKLVERTVVYEHPVFSANAMAAQKALWSLQGANRTWFCGSYFGYGFHEDGAQSGLAVAEQLGGISRPWQVANQSGRITVFAPRSAPDPRVNLSEAIV